MRRFHLVRHPTDSIDAEGVLFDSGMVAVSFLSAADGRASPDSPPPRGVHVWYDMDAARAVHEQIGGRRIVWLDSPA